MNPRVHESCFVHPSVIIIGDVVIKKNCSIWPNAVIRGDQNSIEIGEGSNVQDCCIVHVNEDHPVRIGNGVSMGHGSILHGAAIGDDVIIGMNAVVLNGADVGAGSVIGANAVVKQGMVVPRCSLVLGVPGRVIRVGDERLREEAVQNAATYRALAELHKAGTYTQYVKE